MKTLQISMLTPYYTPEKGGITSYVLNLVTTLGKFNFNTNVIARYGDIDENVTIITPKYYFIIKSCLILSKKKPDIIHAHSNWYSLTPSVIYKIIHPKTRLIFTFHTEPVERMQYLKRVIYQWMLNRCDYITFVSKDLSEKIEKVAGLRIRSKKRVIYGGAKRKAVDEESIKSFKQKFEIKYDEAILLGLGLTALKMKAEGAKILIKAIKSILDDNPEMKIRLFLTRDGPYRAELEDLIKKLRLSKNVTLTGDIENPLAALSVTDIYTQIVLGEGGVSLALLEAMSMGKPIIATRAGGIPEAIVDGENGILVDPNPESIANAILDLLREPEKRERLSTNARKIVEEKFTWEKITKDFLDIYTNSTESRK